MIFIYILVYIYIYITPEFHFHLDSAPRFSGLEMYLEALDKASWSLFPQSLEQDLAKGETFTDANQDGPFHRPQAERLWQKVGTPKSLMNFEVFGVDIDWTSRIWHQVVFLHFSQERPRHLWPTPELSDKSDHHLERTAMQRIPNPKSSSRLNGEYEGRIIISGCDLLPSSWKERMRNSWFAMFICHCFNLMLQPTGDGCNDAPWL